MLFMSAKQIQIQIQICIACIIHWVHLTATSQPPPVSQVPAVTWIKNTYSQCSHITLILAAPIPAPVHLRHGPSYIFKISGTKPNNVKRMFVQFARHQQLVKTKQARTANVVSTAINNEIPTAHLNVLSGDFRAPFNWISRTIKETGGIFHNGRDAGDGAALEIGRWRAKRMASPSKAKIGSCPLLHIRHQSKNTNGREIHMVLAIRKLLCSIEMCGWTW